MPKPRLASSLLAELGAPKKPPAILPPDKPHRFMVSSFDGFTRSGIKTYRNRSFSTLEEAAAFKSRKINSVIYAVYPGGRHQMLKD